MIRSIVAVAALGFALAGCTTGTTTEAPAPVTPPAAPAPAVAPVVEPAPAVKAPIVEQAPAVEQPQQSPALTCEPYADARFDPANPNIIVNKACGYTDEQGQERSHNPWIDDQLDAARESTQQQMEQAKAQVPNMPMPPSVSPGESGYEQQMDNYRGEIDAYMCAEGNAYTVPSNQRSC